MQRPQRQVWMQRPQRQVRMLLGMSHQYQTKNEDMGVGAEERWQKNRPMAKGSPKVTKVIKHEVIPLVAMVHASMHGVDPLLCN